MMDIKFSVIIPVYNVEKTLNRCLKSVVGQSYQNIEIIVINDGSTDNSESIIKKYDKKYSNIKAFHVKNGGLSKARNLGIQQSSGEYIMFLDSDDYITQTACEKFYEIITAKSTMPDVIAGGTIKHIGEKKVNIKRVQSDLKVISGSDFLINEMSPEPFYTAACGSIYKRDFLLENNLFFPKGLLHEDEYFTPLVYLKADNVISYNLMFYHYVIREDSITTSKDKTKNALSIFEIARQLKPVYDKVNNQKLKRLLKSHLAKICFNVIDDAELYKQELRHIIDLKVLEDNSIFLKEKIRLFLLKINPRFLHLAYKAIRLI